MRLRRLRKLWTRLNTLQTQELTYKDLLMKLGAARAEAGLCWGAVEVTLPEPPAKAQKADPVTFSFRFNRKRLRQMRQREGRYLLRSNLTERRLHALAPGLTARAALEKLSAISMIDVHLPTTDGRTLQLSRYTQPEKETQILLEKLNLELPSQPPPKITAPARAIPKA